VLDDSSHGSEARIAIEVHKALLLERIGRYKESRALLNRLTKSRALTPSQRSMCEHTLGRIEWDEGDRRAALNHFSQAVTAADGTSDLNQRCWPRMSLLLATSQASESSAVNEMLARVRSEIFQFGDARALAGLHETLGRIEGKRGLARGAESHFRRAAQLLSASPDVYLEGLIELEVGVIAGLAFDVRSAIVHTERSLALAEQSGSLKLRRACLANLAFCLYVQGDFESAVAHLENAEAVLTPTGDIRNAMLETLARIRLAQGSLDDCAAILSTIESSAQTPDDRLLWAQRHAALTRTRLLIRQAQFVKALRQCEQALETARRAQDQRLSRMVLAEKAHILQRLNRPTESLQILNLLLDSVPHNTPDLYAEYEILIACALLLENKPSAAQVHRRRAERIFTGLGCRPDLVESSRRYEGVASARTVNTTAIESQSEGFSPANAVQAVAALLTHSSRPDLFARGLIDLLAASNCTVRIAATAGKVGQRRILLSHGEFEDRKPESLSKRLPIANTQDDPVDVWVEPRGDAESTATMNAITLLVSTISELECGRLQREQELRLWPIEDVDVTNDEAVINGSMRRLMMKARKVATTNISVLLTGESGTGKEIFARAIHTFSERHTKPFVPFNCAALPRDMVESQLFGHRRGAFTGADRDNLGVIRAARGGTLFLDEIGELSIELQPKLLRFLESYEICPLGETTPFIVDVRIVAATNARLEQAVQDGRFREDLFYRLHGVRLEIPPLRERRDELPSLVHHFLGRAAIEFKKGHVRIAEDTMERLLIAPWPGNIRQLQNELRRMVALAEADAILTPASLSPDIAGIDHDTRSGRDAASTLPAGHAKLNPTLERIEREMVRAALQQHRGKMDDAAKALGISRKGLYLKRQRLGL
jgi:DNA-binding NtrC family response regulator/tetratricopeptide (TPR) repeat protein